MICAAYPVPCEKCQSEEHLNYQCEYSINPILATYNSSDECHASMEVVKLVPPVGASEIIPRIRNTRVKCILLENIYKKVHPIDCICLDFFS